MAKKTSPASSSSKTIDTDMVSKIKDALSLYPINEH